MTAYLVAQWRLACDEMDEAGRAMLAVPWWDYIIRPWRLWTRRILYDLSLSRERYWYAAIMKEKHSENKEEHE